MANAYLTDAQTSKRMKAVRLKGTAPERIMRAMLRQLRIRFRSQVAALPGRPDFVLPDLRVAIFIHGCFWHRHAGCPRATTPVRNKELWARKFELNRSRDRRSAKLLARTGWRVMILWECEVRSAARLHRRLEVLKRWAAGE